MQYHLVSLLIPVIALTLVYKNYDDLRYFASVFKIPRNVGDAKEIGSFILEYRDEHYYTVLLAYFSSYVILQSLCIPGSIVLSILAGYLFPAPLALLLICTCSTLGAASVYFIIHRFRATLLNSLPGYINSKVESFNNYVQAKLIEYNSNLFLFVFVLRATPIFPNWTINLSSPLVNLPFKPFVLGTFTGIAPLSVIHVWTGQLLNDMSNDESLVNWRSILMTSLLAVSIVLLVYIRRIA